MISIIICSVKKDERPKVEANIKTTIGDIKYEVLWIDNTENRYSIFQAYEEGTRKAQYKYLCFMHEDIVFHSQDWGRTCIKRMEEDEKMSPVDAWPFFHSDQSATSAIMDQISGALMPMPKQIKI